jgi:hypothetical protein
MMRESRFEVSLLKSGELTNSDVEDIVALVKELDPERPPPTRGSILGALMQPMSIVVIARDPKAPHESSEQGRIVGMVLFVSYKTFGTYKTWAEDLVIHTDYKGFNRGLILEKLMHTAVCHVRDVWNQDVYDDTSSRPNAREAFKSLTDRDSKFITRVQRETFVFRNFLKRPKDT